MVVWSMGSWVGWSMGSWVGWRMGWWDGGHNSHYASREAAHAWTPPQPANSPDRQTTYLLLQAVLLLKTLQLAPGALVGPEGLLQHLGKMKAGRVMLTPRLGHNARIVLPPRALVGRGGWEDG